MIERKDEKPLRYIERIKGSDFESIKAHKVTSALCSGKAKPSGSGNDPNKIPEGCENFAPCNKENIYKKYIINAFNNVDPDTKDIKTIASKYNKWDIEATEFYKKERTNATDLYDELTELVCLKNGIKNTSAFEKCNICNPDDAKYKKVGNTLCKCQKK